MKSYEEEKATWNEFTKRRGKKKLMSLVAYLLPKTQELLHFLFSPPHPLQRKVDMHGTGPQLYEDL